MKPANWIISEIKRLRVNTKELPRIALVALFCFAACDKLLHFSGFIAALQGYHILPAETEQSVALFIIMAEFAIAFGLLTRKWRRPACLFAVGLLASFTLIYLITDPEKVCGCWFTLTLAKGGTLHTLQNLTLIGLAVLTWLDSQTLPTRTGRASSIHSELPLASGQDRSDGGTLAAQILNSTTNGETN